MLSKCPGQDKRKTKAENIICHRCGYLAEIFSDENKVICPRCKLPVIREKLPTCIDWCKAARECIGEQRWKQTKGGK